MDITQLSKFLRETKSEMEKSKWELCFFRTMKSEMDYQFAEARFASPQHLAEYADSVVLGAIAQLEKVESLQDFDEFNTQADCDVISLDHPLIMAEWLAFMEAFHTKMHDHDEEMKSGYFLRGEFEEKEIGFMKMANARKNPKNAHSFTLNSEGKLVMIEQDLFAMAHSVDSIFTGSALFNFNRKFENALNVERTAKRIKQNAIEKIIDVNFINNPDKFIELAEKISDKTFAGFDWNFNQIDRDGAFAIVCDVFGLDPSNELGIMVENKEQAEAIVKILTKKAIKDAETGEYFSTPKRIPLIAEKEEDKFELADLVSA